METDKLSSYMRKKQRTAWAEINLDNIRYNIRSIRGKTGNSEIIGVVKADGYGHGAAKVAEALQEEGVSSFGVATLQEGIALREAGIKGPVIILSLTPRGNEAEVLEYGFIPVISTGSDAEALSRRAGHSGKRAEMLLALETGMGRVGFLHDAESVETVRRINELPHVKIKGLFSHFATADEADLSYAREQIRRFDRFAGALEAAGIHTSYRTMANSAAIMNFPESCYDGVRPGIVMYGHYPSGEVDRAQLAIRPAMCVKANIVLLKKVPPGFSVSYGAAFTTRRESLIGTLPLGYADGLPRVLSGKGRVIVGGAYAPIVGNICMDQCMIDVTDVPGVKEYDEAVVLGAQDEKTITPDEIGEKTGTINYEVVCRFGQRLPKIYLYGAKHAANRLKERTDA
ncbi:MAG: alanine racemase [Clostridiales Family XIII bacterium]|jgi:alanine racemase|nr:alanine racemase [Clostridiales Family XIII bacterium]